MSHFQKRIKTRPQKKHLPWLNEEIWSLMKQSDDALKTSLETKLATDRLSFVTLRNSHNKNQDHER